DVPRPFDDVDLSTAVRQECVTAWRKLDRFRPVYINIFQTGSDVAATIGGEGADSREERAGTYVCAAHKEGVRDCRAGVEKPAGGRRRRRRRIATAASGGKRCNTEREEKRE